MSARHRLGDEDPNFLRRFDEVLVDDVGVARCRGMAPVAEQLADEWKVLA